MARDFNGSSDKIEFGNSLATLNMPVSCIAWLQPGFASTDTSLRTALCRPDNSGNSNGFELVWVGSSNVWFAGSANAYAYSMSDADAPFSADEWHCIGFKVTGASAARTGQFFWDGVAKTTTEVADLGGAEANTANQNFNIGFNPADGRYWPGAIGPMGVWNTDLNANEFAAAARGEALHRIRPASLIFAPPLWGLHSPEIDFGPSRLSGTVTGTTRSNGPPVGLFTPQRHSFIMPEAGGGGTATASGTPDAQPSTVDGAATSGSTASGTPEAQASTVSGVAVGAWFASGTPEAQPSTVDGAAASRSTASGSPDAQASDVAGAATSSSAAAGDPEAGASTVDGSASVSGGTTTASGTPDAQASTVSGAAAGSSTAAGTPDAQAATVDGAATAFWDVTAAIQAAPSTVEGAGSSWSAASGDAPAGECTVVGVAFSMSTGQGVLVCLASTVTGSEAEIIQIARALMGGLLVKVGRLMAR